MTCFSRAFSSDFLYQGEAFFGRRESDISRSAGNSNGAASTATFNGPVAVLIDARGNLVIVDHLGARIRKISLE